MNENLLGIDIGGTKCAIIYGKRDGDSVEITDKVKFATTGVDETIANILGGVEAMMAKPWASHVADR